jgi:preprotein translocase subunit SecG
MDNLLIIVLAVIDAMVALLLIAVVLVQQSKDGGMGGSPFGGAGDAVFGGQAADHLTKITVTLAAIFLILTLSLAIITGRRTSDEVGVVEGTIPEQQTEMTAIPQPESKKQVEKADEKILKKIDGIKKKVKPPEIKTKVVEDVKSKTKKTTK